MTTTTHVHQIASEDGDECACGQILCPDTGTAVGYSDDGPVSYWHLDGSTCFLHQVAVPTIVDVVAHLATLPNVGDDIVVSMQPPARRYTCRMIVEKVQPFGSLVLVSGPELKLTGERTARRKNLLRLDLATWRHA